MNVKISVLVLALLASPPVLADSNQAQINNSGTGYTGNMMINQGDDAILLDRDGVREHLPYIDFEQTRFPIYGGLLHPRGGSARHDAVAWGYARGADRRGEEAEEEKGGEEASRTAHGEAE